MSTTRLEAFSDGVMAIIITIMVLEIKVPHGHDWADLKPLLPVASSYLVSFVTVGIYWGNHHHILHTAKHVDGKIILANLHLLLWLSVLPFASGWLGESHFAPNTIVLYAIVFIGCGLAWTILQALILKQLPEESPTKMAVKKLRSKALLSNVCALSAIPLAYYYPIGSGILFIFQSVIWLVPDQRVERAIIQEHRQKSE